MRSILITGFFFLALVSCRQPKEKTTNMEHKNMTVENMMSRRSIRSYLPEQVKPEQLDTIIRCAVNAPSALNKQSWEIRIIQKPELLNEINEGFVNYAKGQSLPGSASRAQEPGFSVFHGAPTLIIVANDRENAYSPVDCGLLGQNILLSAESMDIGTCVVGSLKAYFDTPEAEKTIAKLNLPEGYQALYTIALGYKNQRPEAKPREINKVQIIR